MLTSSLFIFTSLRIASEYYRYIKVVFRLYDGNVTGELIRLVGLIEGTIVSRTTKRFGVFEGLVSGHSVFNR